MSVEDYGLWGYDLNPPDGAAGRFFMASQVGGDAQQHHQPVRSDGGCLNWGVLRAKDVSTGGF